MWWLEIDASATTQLLWAMLNLVEHKDNVYFRCVEDCNEPIMITDERGTLTYVNPAWSKIYGYSREEAVGDTPRLLRSETQTDTFYHAMWSQILDPSRGSWKGELINKAKDGRLVPVLLTITPYRDAQNIIKGYMGVALDLTQTKQMQQSLEQQEKMVAVGFLTSGLAHEIGTPLGVVRGRAELLMQTSREETTQKGLGIIITQIDRISKLISSLLRVSRKSPEQVKVGKILISPVIQEVTALLEHPFRKQRVDLRFECADGAYAFADAQHLHQILLNLLMNSLHAIEEEQKIELTQSAAKSHFIVLRVNQNSEFLEIVVRDSGIGMTSQTQSNLFQPFFTTKDIGKGTGLGLTMTSKLVDEMGGSISAWSEGLHKGAQFVIRLRTRD